MKLNNKIAKPTQHVGGVWAPHVLKGFGRKPTQHVGAFGPHVLKSFQHTFMV